MSSAQKPPEIIIRFARQLSHILAKYLSIQDFIRNKRHPLGDRFAMKLIQTLSYPLYQKELLYHGFDKKTSTTIKDTGAWDRDENEQQIEADQVRQDEIVKTQGCAVRNINQESLFYVAQVLGKSLQPATKRKAEPSNLHALLVRLCQCSMETDWLTTGIERKQTPAPDIQESFFNPVAKLLKHQCQQHKNLSEIAVNNRKQYGILCLTAGNNYAEILEEITLFNVVDVLDMGPALLNITIQELPEWYATLMQHIMLTLNEKYGLLRSCGLPPQDFWEDDLSISKLRELKNLIKKAKNYKNEYNHDRLYNCYCRAFSELLNTKAAVNLEEDLSEAEKKLKIAGFETFSDFVGSKVGAYLLKTPFVPLYNHNADDPDEEPIDLPDLSENDYLEANEELWRILALEKKSGNIPPLLEYFYVEALINGRPIHGQSGILKDAEFLALLDMDGSNIDVNPEKLCQEIKALLFKHKPFGG